MSQMVSEWHKCEFDIFWSCAWGPWWARTPLFLHTEPLHVFLHFVTHICIPIATSQYRLYWPDPLYKPLCPTGLSQHPCELIGYPRVSMQATRRCEGDQKSTICEVKTLGSTRWFHTGGKWRVLIEECNAMVLSKYRSLLSAHVITRTKQKTERTTQELIYLLWRH